MTFDTLFYFCSAIFFVAVKVILFLFNFHCFSIPFLPGFIDVEGMDFRGERTLL
jgi:hypothetical protein